MFCIVYILTLKQNYVVPIEWLYGSDSHIEKFMNYGVNANQTYRIYWTDDPAAFEPNGLPKKHFELNKHAPQDATFPSEGWYKCHITKFRGNYY